MKNVICHNLSLVDNLFKPNRSLEFALISLFMASRLILYFPEGIAGYVEEKCVLKYRQKLESSQIV